MESNITSVILQILGLFIISSPLNHQGFLGAKAKHKLLDGPQKKLEKKEDKGCL